MYGNDIFIGIAFEGPWILAAAGNRPHIFTEANFAQME
jgi:hypothetical protein